MYAKYRLYLKTSRGGYIMAASNTVNDLAGQVVQWLEQTSAGRSVYDDMVQSVVLYELDEKTGNYKFSREIPAGDRRDIIRQARVLGAR